VSVAAIAGTTTPPADDGGDAQDRDHRLIVLSGLCADPSPTFYILDRADLLAKRK
jgi:hypothetical protein